MKLLPVPDEEAAIRRFVEELWLPYHRTLESIVDPHALAPDVDVVAEEVEFRLDQSTDEDREVWLAVDADSNESVDVTRSEVQFAGFISADVDEAPSVFRCPDRLVVRDVFVREPYRGTGVGHELIRHAAGLAREAGCEEIALDVHVDNDRAVGFYESLGFETSRRTLFANVDEFQLS